MLRTFFKNIKIFLNIKGHVLLKNKKNTKRFYDYGSFSVQLKKQNPAEINKQHKTK